MAVNLRYFIPKAVAFGADYVKLTEARSVIAATK